MITSYGYAGFSADSPLQSYTFTRRDVGENDVLIRIEYCGICHSDIHHVRNEWHGATYPMVPGHEIIGVVEKVGTQVSRHRVGDTVGVGCMVNSCGHCHECLDHQEQFCIQGTTYTYNSVDTDGQTTKGGYSNNIVVDEKFVLSIPSSLNKAQAAPLLCAGITTYSPLKHWNIQAQDKVGIVGLGGLGHMAVKIANAMGAYVVVFTTSPHKISDAKRLGAHEVIVSSDIKNLTKHQNSFDFILDTVSAAHDLDMYLNLLKRQKTLCMVGLSPKSHTVQSFNLIRQKNLSGSLIGGLQETQEMLNFCGQHQISSDIELIHINQINQAYERMLKGEVKYRFVIDLGLGFP